MMRTNRDELTVHAKSIELLAKALHPLPEKFHGLVDQEIRYRQRYLDLMMNEESREVFRLRAKVVSAIRRFFEERDFLEVETPMMQPGGLGRRGAPLRHPSQCLGPRALSTRRPGSSISSDL